MSFKVKIILLALVGTILAVLIQEINYHHLKGDFPAKNGLLTSADEASYFVPPLNFLESGVWKDNSKGNSSYVQRPPGYGIVFMSTQLFGTENAFFALKIIQVCCFFFSVILFGLLLHEFVKLKETTAFIGTIPYAILPCFSGFMYYTLSESITPFLVLFSIYSGLQFVLKKSKNWLWVYLLSTSFLILVRPQLAFIPLLFVFLSVIREFNFKRTLLVCLVFLPFLMWHGRSVFITKEFSSIHPIYSETNQSLYRPVHHSLCELLRVWEADGERFHSLVAQLNAPDSLFQSSQIIELIPQNKQISVLPLLMEYRKVQMEVNNYILKNKTIQENLSCEKSLILRLESLRKQLISNSPFEYYLSTPLKSLTRLAVSSHLNLRIFQIDYRGVFWVEILRWLCLFFILGSILCSFILTPILAIKKKDWATLGLILFMGMYLFYLCFIQRMNEERYITPILPIFYLLAFYSFYEFWKRIRNNLNRWI
jgi:hypothetical protein